MGGGKAAMCPAFYLCGGPENYLKAASTAVRHFCLSASAQALAETKA
jgi:hypothetical protein